MVIHTSNPGQMMSCNLELNRKTLLRKRGKEIRPLGNLNMKVQHKELQSIKIRLTVASLSCWTFNHGHQPPNNDMETY